MEAFVEMKKIPRLSRDCIITEKIDGTNASILIGEGPIEHEVNGRIERLPFLCASRTRWIFPNEWKLTPDNAGFADWAYKHSEELLKLGPGHHFGEWWGLGINKRKYGLKEKKFSLFNVSRWRTICSDAPEKESLPGCVGVVPILYEGPFSTTAVDEVMLELKRHGSYAAPGCMEPEGVVIFHTACGYLFKKTFEGDEKGKGA